MSKVVVFKLVHKATGRAMPARMFSSTPRGWSYWEPSDPTAQGYKPNEPRIFHTRISAAAAGGNWAKGEHKTERGVTNSFESPEEYSHQIINAPAVSRSYSDLEIVEGTLEWNN